MADSAAIEASRIRRGVAAGAAWTIFIRICDRCLGIVSTFVLARLLVPSDFGLVAIATSIVAGVEVLGEFGFDQALIRNVDARKEHLNTIWTLTIIRGIAFSVILAASAPLAASFFDEPRLVNVVRVLALTSLLDGFINVGVILFRKDLRFDLDFYYSFAARLGAFCLTILVAWILRSYWALILGTVLSAAIKLVLSYSMSSYRPRLCLETWRETMRFSIWMLLSAIFVFINRSSDRFVLGKLLGTQAVGFYSISKQISNLASSELVAPIRRASLPGFAQLTRFPDQFRKTFIDMWAMIVTITLPVAAGIGLVADLIVPIMLGEKWRETIPLVQILALYGVVETCRSQARPATIALNRPELGTMVAGVRCMVVIPAMYFGAVHYGVIGGAWAITISTAAAFVMDYVIVSHVIGVRFSNLWSSAWRTFAAVGAMAIVVQQVKTLGWRPDAAASWDLLLLLLTVLAGATAYGVTLLLLWTASGRPSGPEHLLVKTLGAVVKRALSVV